MKETTLREILKHNPCQSGLKKLLEGLNYSNLVTETELDKPIATKFILDNNGYDDCIWVLRVFARQSNWYRFKADIAESVLKYWEEKYPNDNRPLLAIKASRYLADIIDSYPTDFTVLPAADSAAYYAAYYAARSVADSADSAAYYAARSALYSIDFSDYSADTAARSARSAARSTVNISSIIQKKINIKILLKYIA